MGINAAVCAVDKWLITLLVLFINIVCVVFLFSFLSVIINKYNIKSAIDLGCGPGGMVELMKSHNINAIGIDGDFTITRNIECIIHDFTSGPLDVNPSDLCWTVEFLEHVKPEYIINYFSVIEVKNLVETLTDLQIFHLRSILD